MQPSTLTLEQIKDLISFCRSNGVNYIEHEGLKVQLVPEMPEIRQPTNEELLYGNFGSTYGAPSDSGRG